MTGGTTTGETTIGRTTIGRTTIGRTTIGRNRYACPRGLHGVDPCDPRVIVVGLLTTPQVHRAFAAAFQRSECATKIAALKTSSAPARCAAARGTRTANS